MVFVGYNFLVEKWVEWLDIVVECDDDGVVDEGVDIFC